MKDLLMSCKAECPHVSRDSLNHWVSRSSKRNQHGNWNSILNLIAKEVKSSSVYGLGIDSHANKIVIIQGMPPFLLWWIMMWGSGWGRHCTLSDFQLRCHSGIQPRYVDKTIFPGERKALLFVVMEVLVQEQWKLWLRKWVVILLVCISTQVNLESFLSLDHAVLSVTGKYGIFEASLLKIMKTVHRIHHYFWGS